MRPGAFSAMARAIERLPLPEPERQPGDDRPTLVRFDRADGSIELHGENFPRPDPRDRRQSGVLIARVIRGQPTHYVLNSVDHEGFVSAVAAWRRREGV
jgi:hypothetical protein